MKKLLGIVVLGLFIASQGQAKVKTKDINFPGKFYTTELKSCKAIGKLYTFDNSRVTSTIDGLIGFNANCILERSK